MSMPEMIDATSAQVVEIGKLKVLPGEHIAAFDGVVLDLTHKEFQLLSLFARNHGRLLDRDRISKEIWGGKAPGRTIDIHVSRLRRLLPKGAIETVIRVGYRMVLTG
jgi:two-component system, OmpR family, alkaline phosphatase synthesis response regulator PhoP